MLFLSIFRRRPLFFQPFSFLVYLSIYYRHSCCLRDLTHLGMRASQRFARSASLDGGTRHLEVTQKLFWSTYLTTQAACSRSG
jgi:hypothetical protein